MGIIFLLRLSLASDGWGKTETRPKGSRGDSTIADLLKMGNGRTTTTASCFAFSCSRDWWLMVVVLKRSRGLCTVRASKHFTEAIATAQPKKPEKIATETRDNPPTDQPVTLTTIF